jgi:predicted TIM-barrel fold metal-dependent hydrolase
MNIPQEIIDIHTHLWSDASGYSTLPENEEQLLRMADRFNLEKILVMPLYGGIRPTIDQIRVGNNLAAEYALKDRRIVPFGRVEAHLENDALTEAKRCVDQLGMRGIKIWISKADDPKLFQIVEYMINVGLPIMIHAMHKSTGQYKDESDPMDVCRLAKHYPDATLIMAHMGGDFIYGCRAIADAPNILTDMSGSYCENGMVEWAVKTLGAKRVLFGTDAPGASFINNVAKVAAADISEEDKRMIFYHNARRLLG